jgi:stearoyl-CoA desaturase (delta-9 desaturase)
MVYVRWIGRLALVGLRVTTLALTHVTIAAVTIFLHRHQAHRALDLHPLAHIFFACGCG